IEDIHQHMVEKIVESGGEITKVYYCPHDSHEQCDCRKPAPGMLKQAAVEFGIDLTRSFIVGDAWTDVQAGLAVGAQSILVMTGRGKQYFHNCLSQYSLRVGAACDLADAAEIITSTLHGNYVDTTPRLRRSFHMALRPEELIVL
ncbi:MAG: HAD-IIIA family hydrolase, partial [Anaerolineae bacterium]|nr:HAD-IIIA family hydrolase [Anaerolineae bacterium]